MNMDINIHLLFNNIYKKIIKSHKTIQLCFRANAHNYLDLAIKYFGEVKTTLNQ